MPDNSQPNWRGKSSTPPPGAAGRAGGWRAETTGEAKGSGRKILFVGLTLGCVAAVAALVWLLLVPTPPKIPTIVVVAANPTAAAVDRLDVPPDVYGWSGARKLADWTTKAAQGQRQAGVAPKLLSDNGQPYPLHDPNWAWVEAIAADDKADPVVIYVGAHGTVDNDGNPSFYTGGVDAAGNPGLLKLRDVLDKLGSGRLKDKKKVLVLDPARTPPNPATGELTPLFVTRLKEDENVPDKSYVAKCENLILICASGAGERGWDSEAFGQPVFAERLQKALAGQFVAQDGRSSYTAWQLFQEVEKQTTEWTRSRRPTAQTPLLFPLTSGKERAEKMRLGIALDDPDGAKPAVVPAPSLAGLAERWTRCQELLTQNPSQPPHAYAPRLWRRYRDLLVRYDGIVRAGQEAAPFARDLADKLDKMRDRIEELGKVDLASSLPYAHALPLATTGTGSVPAADAVLLAAATSTDAATKPADHLARMLHARYRDPKAANTSVKLPAPAAQLVATRLAADQAMPGVLGWKPGSGAPYAERLGPVIAPRVQAADRIRRQGEDRVFGPAKQGEKDWHAEAGTLLTAADTAYRTTQVELADPLRFAYQVSDRAVADLPYLAAWAAEVDGEKLTEARKAWDKAHKLADAVDAAGREPARADAARMKSLRDDAEALKADVEALEKAVDAVLGSVSSAAVTTNLPPTESLLTLPPPLLSAANRAGLLSKFQSVFRSLDEGEGKQQSRDADESRRKILAARRAVAGLASLPEADRRTAADRLHAEADWEKEASKVGVLLREKYRELATKAKFPAPPATPEEEKARTADDRKRDRELAERASRLAVPFARPGDDDPEPAAEVRKARWQLLLEGLALQAAADHWYDGQQKPYFKVAAGAFLKDAAKLSPAVAAGNSYVPPAAVAALLAREPWSVTQPFAGPVSWTSEQDRSFTFRLDKKGWPADAEGFPAVAVGLETKTSPVSLLRLGAAFKELEQLLPPGEAAVPPVPVAIASNDAVGTGSAFITADVYFRGQRPASRIELALARRPEWTVSNVKPRAEEGAMIAVKSDDDVSVGAIAIVLDLSGSMKAAAEGTTRHKLAVRTLLEILDSFPDGNYPSVSLRVYGLAIQGKESDDTGDNTRRTEIKQVFPKAGRPPAKMTPEKIAELKSAAAALLTADPVYYTPLVRSMGEALKDGFPEGYDGPKTLLALTDGMDTAHGQIILKDDPKRKEKATTPAEQQAIVRAVQADFEALDAFRVPIQVVFFSAREGARDQEDAEERVAREQFAAVRRFKSPGELWSAQDKKALLKKLDLALRPKPRLVRPTGDAAEGVPAFGLPTNRVGDQPNQLRWYGRESGGVTKPAAGRYELDLLGLDRQPVAFDDGDRLLVRIKKTGDGTQFSREVFFREYLPKADRTDRTRTRLDESADWLVAAPQNQILFPNNKQTLSLVTGVEYLKALSPGKGGVLRHVRPQFLWWEVSFAAQPKPARDADGDLAPFGRVENLSGYPTPTWQLTVEDWPNAAAGRGFAEPRLRAWPVLSLADLNPAPTFPNPLRMPASLRTESRGTARDRNGVDYPVRVTHEEVRLRTSTKGDKGTAKCLVVRIDYPPGKEVYASRIEVQLKDRILPVQYDEHRYYRKANGYTAFVGPVEDRDLEGGAEVLIELVSIPEMKKLVKPLVLDALGPPLESDPRPDPPVPQKDIVDGGL